MRQKKNHDTLCVGVCEIAPAHFFALWGLYHWLDSQEGSYDYVKEYIDTEYMKAEDLEEKGEI